ncbi:hypothetical protein E9531_14165 [Lampropedia puyangensis]|uniref:Uncharacterized protein n=1 Tax=Lampropedia puyangensis TaxID=1330072 RepID=A0A4S8EUD8_9BURK|nr:hypothetical protein [Lampropedia puyangensis]THT98467.1 hypothetical protein E9531_14165 [Lampropedia puyangensis]
MHLHPSQPPHSKVPRRHALQTLGALVAAPWLLSACQSQPETAEEGSQPVAPAPHHDPLAIDWLALNEALGQYPHQAPFLEQSAITARLTSLLGKDGYAAAMQNLQVSGPLSVEGSVFFITGNRAHQGGVEAVAIALDEASNRIRVWLLQSGQTRSFAEQDTTFAWPRDVQIMIGNAQL